MNEQTTSYVSGTRARSREPGETWREAAGVVVGDARIRLKATNRSRKEDGESSEVAKQ